MLLEEVISELIHSAYYINQKLPAIQDLDEVMHLRA